MATGTINEWSCVAMAVTWLCYNLWYAVEVSWLLTQGGRLGVFLLVLGLKKFEKRWSEPSCHLHTRLNTKWHPPWFGWRDESQGRCHRNPNSLTSVDLSEPHWYLNAQWCHLTVQETSSRDVWPCAAWSPHHLYIQCCCCGTPQRSDMIWAYSWWLAQCLDVSLCRIMCIISARFCIIYI